MPGLITLLAVLAACSALASGYSVHDGKVYWTSGLPARTQEVSGADAATFHDLDGTYARDKSRVYYDGAELSAADVSTFEVLRSGWAKDRSHVWLRAQSISADPGHFELIAGEMAKDASAVYCHDGSVLSHDAAHFVRLSRSEDVLGFTKDSAAVYYYCSAIPDADPGSFVVLDDTDHCGADATHAYHGSSVIPHADPRSFPPGQHVTGCSDTGINFGP